MRIITISREFGSGGRELGKYLAQQLGFDYYDSEIISAVAKMSGLDKHYVEDKLDGHGWNEFPMTYQRTLSSSNYVNASKIALLLQQKDVIEQIGALGKDFVIVGRNADVILKEYHPLNLFVCATQEAKLQRCVERAPEGEHFTNKELLQKMKQIDRMRYRTREILSDASWGQRDAYDLTINTSNWQIKDLAPVVTDFANSWFGREICR